MKRTPSAPAPPVAPLPPSDSARPYLDQALKLVQDWAKNPMTVTGERLDDLAVLLTQALVRLHAEDPTNEGLPCADCGQRQKRLHIERAPDGSLHLRINLRMVKETADREVKGLGKLLRSFVAGL